MKDAKTTMKMDVPQSLTRSLSRYPATSRAFWTSSMTISRIMRMGRLHQMKRGRKKTGNFPSQN